MSESSEFRKQLQRITEQPDWNGSLYLVLSGISVAKPVRHFYMTDGLTARPLFQGTQYAGWQEVMPFLAQVTDTSEFLNWIDETESTDWGWGLVSNAGLDDVFGHVRSLTKILMPDRQEVFFRYWDARYFGPILKHVDDACRAALMGPAAAIVLPDGQAIDHPSVPEVVTPAPEFPWFSLPESTLKSIATLCWDQLVGSTLAALGKKEPSPLYHCPESVARHKVDRHLRKLTNGGVVTELSPEQVHTIHKALMREARGVH